MKSNELKACLRIAALVLFVGVMVASNPARAATLVYEGFEYTAGDDVTTPLNGGTGFAGAWTPGQQGGVITVYDETAETVINDNAGGELTWNGVVDNLPTSPDVGSRFIATGPSGTADRIAADRVLSQDAGTMAGVDNILWASVVWHQQGNNYGRHVGFTIGTDGLSNRSANCDKTGNFGAGIGDAIGVGGAYNTGLVTPVVFDNGAIAVRTTTDASTVSYSVDNIVILKFVFADGAGLDRVYAYRFLESDTLSEATFDANAVYAEYAIDQSTLDIVSISQSRGQEAVDEIRIGDTFDDVISGTGPQTEDLEFTDIQFSPVTDRVTLNWKSTPGETYGLYWSTDMVNFMPDTNCAISAHATTNRTTLGPVGVPDPNADHIFFRLGPPDLADPTADKAWGSAGTVTLVFSEEVKAAAATNTSNFTLQKVGGGFVTINSAALSVHGDTLALTLATPLEIASTYIVTMNNIMDLAGRPLGDGTQKSFQTWDDNPDGVKVFILAGQSNMVGHGKDDQGVGDVIGAVGSLRYMVMTNTVLYGHLLEDSGDPTNSAWATRSDVKVWWRDSDVGDTRAVIKGDLGIGYSQSRNPDWFGPEYGFGWVLGEAYTNPVLLVKTAWGGKSLAVDYRPPSAVAARGGTIGPYYEGMIEYVRDVLGNLETEFPEWEGKGYQIAGFGWHQGWNDRISGPYSAEYEENMADLINDLRAEFGKPDMPVVIGTTGMDPQPSYTTVETAQLAVGDPGQHPEFAGTVMTVDTRPCWRDASISPSSFGYHWNHNGETHFLVGDGMGRAMESLVTP